MDYRKMILTLLVLVLGITSYANATPVNLKFENVGPGYSDGAYYVYPYNFYVNNSTDLIAMLCDDFRDDIYFGESWKANANSFSDIVAGQGQMQPNGGLVATGERVTAYKDAAWLYQSLKSNPTLANSIAINHTIWGLFTSTQFNGSSDVAFWFAAASGATSGLSNAQAENLFKNVAFFTPIANTQNPGYGQPQEFIGTVPEPATWLLLGPGLLLLGLVARRKHSAAH